VAKTRASKFSDVDRDAFKRAIETMLRSPEAIYRTDFKRRLNTKEPWEKIGRDAASVCQCRALKLAPWQTAPHQAEPNQIDEVGFEHRATAVASALLGKLLAAGCSRFEPNPIAAIEAAEVKRDGRRQ
jgi:hypothetical protein